MHFGLPRWAAVVASLLGWCRGTHIHHSGLSAVFCEDAGLSLEFAKWCIASRVCLPKSIRSCTHTGCLLGLVSACEHFLQRQRVCAAGACRHSGGNDAGMLGQPLSLEQQHWGGHVFWAAPVVRPAKTLRQCDSAAAAAVCVCPLYGPCCTAGVAKLKQSYAPRLSTNETERLQCVSCSRALVMWMAQEAHCSCAILCHTTTHGSDVAWRVPWLVPCMWAGRLHEGASEAAVNAWVADACQAWQPWP